MGSLRARKNRYTSWPIREHTRELGGLFVGLGQISVEVLDKFIESRKRKKYLKQSLERFIENGLIEKREKTLVVTKKGIPFFRRIAIEKELRNRKLWDGKWRLITYDVPVEEYKKSNQMRKLLREFDFYQLQKSVWAYPNHLAEKFWKLLVELDLDQYCKVMLVDFLGGDEDLKQHFEGVIKTRG